MLKLCDTIGTIGKISEIKKKLYKNERKND